tara:strand:+ start:742 stop:1473 length:732 start_codon:yes stop_codon:yes gene_type:complete
MKFGFLSTFDNQLLPGFINAAIREGIKNIHIIIDSKETSKKDIEIFKLRTNGAFGSYSSINQLLFNLNESSIPFYLVDNHISKHAIELYDNLKLDCLLNAGTPRKISNEIIKIIEKGVINIHPGILPIYRGCSCIEWAILNDDPIGNTAHYMDNEYDTGPIIKTESYNFSSQSNYIDIRKKVYYEGFKLAAKVLKGIELNQIIKENASLQDEKKGKFWEPISRELEKESIRKANDKKYKFQNL